MQTVGAQWMLVGDPRAAVLVPLVQTATTLPVMLLALPSGVLADLIDRRRLLIATQGAMAAGVGLLATLTGAGLTTPAVLLMLLFVIGCGQALTAPAWQAIQPDLVPPEQIPAAAALGSMSMNGARAIGPAIAGCAGVAVRADPGLRAQRGVLRRDRDRAGHRGAGPPSSRPSRRSARWQRSVRAADSSAAPRSCGGSCCGPRCSSRRRARCGACCR